MIEKKEDKKREAAGLFIPAGLFLGFAYGFMSGNIAVGMFGGLGIGFLLYATVMVFKK
jgi:hypothetical protein